MSKPKCFQFLECTPFRLAVRATSTNSVVVVCNGPEKCVFVRVVDSCAGCAKGTSHVDLTKAAFSRLANLDKGVLQVEMRPATEPANW
jgi:rare lipoprotein A (peptidoglycan hydrolase)